MANQTQTSSPTWESFAQERPYWYVDMAHDGDMDRFWRCGRESANALLRRVEPYVTEWDTVIEIGCGVGRLLIPMARRFETAVGVDIAPTMLSHLRTNATEQGVAVQTYQSDEAWYRHRANFIYSKIVFRHIADWDVIDRYIRQTRAALRKDGVALFGFDTRPKTLGYRLRRWLPNAVLPHYWQEGARGTRRSPSVLRQAFARHELEIIEEFAPNSGSHDFLLRKRSAPSLST